MRPVTVVSYVAQLGQFRLETRTALKKTELLFKVRGYPGAGKELKIAIASIGMQVCSVDPSCRPKQCVILHGCSPTRT